MLGPNEEEKMMNDEVTTNDQNPLRGKCHLIFTSPSFILVITWDQIYLNFDSWIRRFPITEKFSCYF